MWGRVESSARPFYLGLLLFTLLEMRKVLKVRHGEEPTMFTLVFRTDGPHQYKSDDDMRDKKNDRRH